MTQPSIAEVLGIEYRRPIADVDGWRMSIGDGVDGPAAPRVEMFVGPLGELTRLIAPHVPWDPVAFHVQALTMIGNYIGFGPYMAEGATHRHLNLFTAVIGGTGSGKGSSLAFVNWLTRHIDPDFLTDRVTTSIGSGEGLLAKITDTVFTTTPTGDEVVTIEGSPDKRVVYVEEELGALFTKMVSMETVEKTITKAWDSGVMETTTKKESMKCREPHVSIIGHITAEELHERLDKRLLDNGFSNRWLFFLTKPTSRVHLEPQPGDIVGAVDVARQIAANVRAVATAEHTELQLTPAATDMFEDTADLIFNRPPTGAMKKQNVRWRSQMFKLAALHALVDGKDKVDVDHFAAARAIWGYNARSAATFFAGLTGHAKADEFLSMWSFGGYADLTLTEITAMFSNHMNAHRRNVMLRRLSDLGFIETTEIPTNGRPATTVRYVGDPTDDNPVRTW